MGGGPSPAGTVAGDEDPPGGLRDPRRRRRMTRSAVNFVTANADTWVWVRTISCGSEARRHRQRLHCLRPPTPPTLPRTPPLPAAPPPRHIARHPFEPAPARHHHRRRRVRGRSWFLTLVAIGLVGW